MINKQLEELYQSKWEELAQQLDVLKTSNHNYDQPTNPLLIRVSREKKWENADIRLIFFGMETNSWFGEFNHDMNYSLDKYAQFFTEDGVRRYNSPFWQGYLKLLATLRQMFPGRKIEGIWNNLVKIGMCRAGKLGEKSLQIENQYFSVIEREMEILNPTIIIFSSGPNYDRFITSNFPGSSFDALDNRYPVRQLAKVNLGGEYKAARTYHPAYLRRKRLMDDYYSLISKELVHG